jgi:hypothetical protein
MSVLLCPIDSIRLSSRKRMRVSTMSKTSAFDEAWSMLKALPEQQMFYPAHRRGNLTENPYTAALADGDGIDVGEGQVGYGTVHPAIYGMMQRRMKQMDDERYAHHGGSPMDAEEYLPHLNLRSLGAERMDAEATNRRYGVEDEKFSNEDDELRRKWFMHREPMIDGHLDYQADDSPYPFVSHGSYMETDYSNHKRRTKAPQTLSYRNTHPTTREIRERMGL